jgi:hypothetical protein
MIRPTRGCQGLPAFREVLRGPGSSGARAAEARPGCPAGIHSTDSSSTSRPSAFTRKSPRETRNHRFSRGHVRVHQHTLDAHGSAHTPGMLRLLAGDTARRTASVARGLILRRSIRGVKEMDGSPPKSRRPRRRRRARRTRSPRGLPPGARTWSSRRAVPRHARPMADVHHFPHPSFRDRRRPIRERCSEAHAAGRTRLLPESEGAREADVRRASASDRA